MASRSFLLLALAFAVILLITSEVAVAKELASDNDSEINESRHGGYNNVGAREGHKSVGVRKGHDDVVVGGGPLVNPGHRPCRKSCCGHGHGKGCSTSTEATTYKQTQN